MTLQCISYAVTYHVDNKGEEKMILRINNTGRSSPCGGVHVHLLPCMCLSVASLSSCGHAVKHGRVSRPTGGSLYTRTDSGSLTPSVPPYGLYFVMVLYIAVGTCCAGCVIVFSVF